MFQHNYIFTQAKFTGKIYKSNILLHEMWRSVAAPAAKIIIERMMLEWTGWRE